MPQPRKKQQKKAEKAKKLHCKIFLTIRFITFLLLRCIWKKFTWDHSYSISFSPFLFRGKVALTMFYWLPHQAEREELSLDQDLNVISRHMQTIQLGSTVNIIGTVGVQSEECFLVHACFSNQSGICSLGIWRTSITKSYCFALSIAYSNECFWINAVLDW